MVESFLLSRTQEVRYWDEQCDKKNWKQTCYEQATAMVFTEGLIVELASGRYTCDCIRGWYREFPFRPYRLLHNKQRRLSTFGFGSWHVSGSSRLGRSLLSYDCFQLAITVPFNLGPLKEMQLQGLWSPACGNGDGYSKRPCGNGDGHVSLHFCSNVWGNTEHQ